MNRRTRLLLLIGIPVVVVALGAVLFGPRIYAGLQPEAPAPLSVQDPATPSTAGADEVTTEEEPTPTETAPEEGAADLEGAWRVGQGSQAGYRVEEVLRGEDVTVVGRTDQVTGTAEVADGALTEAVVEVDVASISTDSGNRDDYFANEAMNADEFPTATFTLTEPVPLPELGAEVSRVQATGTLEIVGQSRPVTADIEVLRDGSTVRASGSVDVTFADWGVEAPSLGFVEVEDTGQVEFLVELTR
ncbi:YceI family protein [Desertihabitans aurantiacus]|uniref:YceI family protein n=1 Tax=Desertihabitans aurantiacus TaxID=2282477 RepID=UPI000DF74106|nr:YceI family protein [Desertihabitans aurantiacus]